MSKIIRCDAPDCGAEISTSAFDVAMVGVRSVTLKGAHGWHYQQDARFVAVGEYGVMELPHLIGGSSAWMFDGMPTFHACSDEHLAAILKAAPPGALVVAFNRLEVKAAALAAVLHVMAEAAAEDEAATA